MSKDKEYKTLTLEDMTEAEQLAIEIVMREGALRFQEQVVKDLYRLKRTVKSEKEAKAIQKSIDIVYRHEVELD
jgi:uncharacterized protein involved in tolerance to divalent cations